MESFSQTYFKKLRSSKKTEPDSNMYYSMIVGFTEKVVFTGYEDKFLQLFLGRITLSFMVLGWK